MEFFQALGAFFIGGGLLWRGAKTAAPATIVAPEQEPQKASRQIYLNTTEEIDKPDLTANTIVIGEQADQELFVKKVANGNIMTVKGHGAYIVSDREGKVLKSRDALGVVREYKYDCQTNQLMVRRFGVWTTPANASVNAEGALSWGDECNQFEEMLDGTFVHRNLASGTTITTDKLRGTETVQRRDGHCWRQASSEQGEEVTIWDNGDLTFSSFTFKDGGVKQASTRQGTITCRNVCRYESHYRLGDLLSESFAFTGPRGGKPASMRIELTTGALLLKNLASIETKLEAGCTTMTTYNMAFPTAFTVDIPKHKGMLNGIVKINSTSINGHEALVFVSERNDEYVVFPGKRDEGKAHEVLANVRRMQDAGSEIPDLYLR